MNLKHKQMAAGNAVNRKSQTSRKDIFPVCFKFPLPPIFIVSLG